MKKILYLDCFSGISGDMFLGALLDLGVPFDKLEEILSQIDLDGYRIHREKTSRSGISGTSFDVVMEQGGIATENHEHGHSHDHDHDHGHEHRSYRDIVTLIANSGLPVNVKNTSLKIFRYIAEAEAAVHDTPIDTVVFHEVGAVDSIVDIVGAAAALEILGIDTVRSSTIRDGSGMITCRHGSIPVPVPAVMKMLENTAIPFVSGTADTELVTPTGIGIIKGIVSEFGGMPVMTVQGIGYGFGKREIGRLNALRAVIGNQSTEENKDRILMLECNIDNATPEQLGYACEKLMQDGALDVSMSPVFMKKWRNGTLLNVLCKPEIENILVEDIFRETGSLGIRRIPVDRHVMNREIKTVNTPLGTARVKFSSWGTFHRVTAEYEDIRELATTNKISYQEAETIILEHIQKDDEE